MLHIYCSTLRCASLCGALLCIVSICKLLFCSRIFAAFMSSSSSFFILLLLVFLFIPWAFYPSYVCVYVCEIFVNMHSLNRIVTGIHNPLSWLTHIPSHIDHRPISVLSTLGSMIAFGGIVGQGMPPLILGVQTHAHTNSWAYPYHVVCTHIKCVQCKKWSDAKTKKSHIHGQQTRYDRCIPCLCGFFSVVLRGICILYGVHSSCLYILCPLDRCIVRAPFFLSTPSFAAFANYRDRDLSFLL